MEAVDMEKREINDKRMVIMCFGPATPTTGFKAGEYYQVTFDPSMCSPSGAYIRFGAYQGDEINGWQRIGAMTVVEDLGLSNAPMVASLPGYKEEKGASVAIRAVS